MPTGNVIARKLERAKRLPLSAARAKLRVNGREAFKLAAGEEIDLV
jgi:hypothetical protein